MTVTRLLFLIIILLLVSGCSQVMVSQDYDKSTRFSQYSTYRWVEVPTPDKSDLRSNNSLLHDRFRSSINKVLQQKGYIHSEGGQLHVNYDYSVNTKIQSSNIEPRIGYGYGRYGRYGGVAVRTGSDIYQFDQAMLIINVYDAVNGNLIWRGKGTDVAATHPDPSKVTDQVYTLVSSILKQFPPEP